MIPEEMGGLVRSMASRCVCTLAVASGCTGAATGRLSREPCPCHASYLLKPWRPMLRPSGLRCLLSKSAMDQKLHEMLAAA